MCEAHRALYVRYIRTHHYYYYYLLSCIFKSLIIFIIIIFLFIAGIVVNETRKMIGQLSAVSHVASPLDDPSAALR